jgi:hypothetical protein
VAPGAPKGAFVIKPPKDYDEHYKNSDATPAQLLLDLSFLKSRNLVVDIEKALKAYLRWRPKVEPWMYETLSVVIEMNHGPPSEVKTALGWAGYLAKRDENPDAMIRVGDLLLLKKIYEITLPGSGGLISPGDLFDSANRRVQHRPEPMLLSIQLAMATKDATRMGSAVEKLLALPWPGFDEAWRTDALKQANLLAKTLGEDGRDEEAKALVARLPEASARDVFARLTWIGDAGVELSVLEPLGATASYLHLRTVFGGAIVKSVYGAKNGECIYSCPRGFDGDYTIKLNVIYNDEKKPVTQALLEIITHEGTPEEKAEKKVISLSKSAPVVVTLKGGRRKEVLPFVAPSDKPQAPPRSSGGSAAPKPPVAPVGAAPTAPIR